MKKIDRSWIDEIHPEEYKYLFPPHKAEIPTVDELPFNIDYCDRGAHHFVISGPLGQNRGPGRHFTTLPDALTWARAHYKTARFTHNCLVPQELLDAGIVTLRRWTILVSRL
jgi:hypothetical protein